MNKLIELWKYRMGRMPHANNAVSAVENTVSSETATPAQNTATLAVANVSQQAAPVPVTNEESNNPQQQVPPIPAKRNNRNNRGNGNNNNANRNNSNAQQVQSQPMQMQQPMTYAGAMLQPTQQMQLMQQMPQQMYQESAMMQQQPIATTRPDTVFQQSQQHYQQPQKHDTNAPAGPLVRAGNNFCPEHRRAGARCRECQGGGCEWQQIFDPIAIANPNIRPLKSYGEVLTERFGLPQPRNQQNNQGNGGNYRQQQQSQPVQHNGNQYVKAGDGNVYHSPPNQNNGNQQNYGNNDVSGNGQRAPTHPNGCQ